MPFNAEKQAERNRHRDRKTIYNDFMRFGDSSKELDGKVRTFWEAHIIWKNLPHGFDVY